jgi:multiple sugar transport system permease protein
MDIAVRDKTISIAPPRFPLNFSREALIRLLMYILLIGGAVIMVLPFVWMASTACKPNNEVNFIPIRFFPQQVACGETLNTLYNQQPMFNTYLFNSFLVTVGRTLGQLVMCTLAAYGYARFKFPGRNVLFLLCLGLLMVPYQAILIPQYLVVQQFGLLNTLAGIIAPNIFSAFSLFLLRQGFMQIPLELEEAAQLDGANPLQVLYRVTIPLCIPTLAAFAVISIQAAWNDFLWPLVVSNTPDTRVVTIGVALLQGERNTPWNLIMMGSLIATLPMMILFLLLQRYFVQGIAMSGLKG